MSYLFEEQERLPYPTKRIEIHGVEIEEYIIPAHRKADVLAEMYLFEPVPSLDEVRFDLHSGRLFTVRDFRVTREHGRNWLVSPHYEDGGGTVIDWMPESWAYIDDNVSDDEEWVDELDEAT